MTVSGELVRLAVRVRASEAEVALARLLPVLTGGAEERSLGEAVEYALYGAAEELPDEASLRALAGEALLGVSRTPVARGWETAWHAHLGRVSAGGLGIRPPWVAGPAEDLVIEPGLTFGAAGHPTTRLCLELLAEVAGGGAPGAGSDPGAPNARMAKVRSPGARQRLGALSDWGCGSGVLAIAAARLGFEPVTAVDIDPGAVALARQNAGANSVQIDVRRTDVTRGRPPSAPTVVANLTLPLLEAAAAFEGPRPRRLIASGVLTAQADAVVAAWRMAERDRREADGWAALLLEDA